jgi:hypothetical protein
MKRPGKQIEDLADIGARKSERRKQGRHRFIINNAKAFGKARAVWENAFCYGSCPFLVRFSVPLAGLSETPAPSH